MKDDEESSKKKRAYSNNLRERVIVEIQGGSTVRDAAEKFQVSQSWAYKIWHRFQTTGSYEALPIPGGPRKIEGEDLKRLKKLVKENPDATLQELIDKGQFKISVRGELFTSLQSGFKPDRVDVVKSEVAFGNDGSGNERPAPGEYWRRS